MSRYSGHYYKRASRDTRKQKRHEAYFRAVEANGRSNQYSYADPPEFLQPGEEPPKKT